MTLSLSIKAPREYPLIEGFRGRVWRNAFNLYAREISLLFALISLYAFLLDHLLWLEIGILGLFLSVVFAGIMTTYINLRRIHLVRTGVGIKAILIEKKKLRLWHEIFRDKAHRSFMIRYRFQLPNQEESIESSFYLCQCAYDHLAKHEELLISYQKNRPKKNVPLRIAVMRIPH
jgi:hypothetical protein